MNLFFILIGFLAVLFSTMPRASKSASDTSKFAIDVIKPTTAIHRLTAVLHPITDFVYCRGFKSRLMRP